MSVLKFRPITYGEHDLVPYRFTGATSVAEGQFCQLGTLNSLNKVSCVAYSGSFSIDGTATLNASAINGAYVNTKKVFPVYRENPDPDTVSATIALNDAVVGFMMKTGNEFEVHKTQTESGFASTFTSIGSFVACGSNGKLTFHTTATANSTDLIIGQLVGTFNATWIRVRCI